ncbi:MAG TPA: hypothetical protein VFC85_01210, partial [Verrucomicrobiae bacterium]|nr:hypothetical protein [Verrucomicrobiae bacterium]
VPSSHNHTSPVHTIGARPIIAISATARIFNHVFTGLSFGDDEHLTRGRGKLQAESKKVA